MFNFTLPELVVIFVVALIVVGPKKLPELARVLGRAIGDLQRALQGAREHIDTEINNTTKLFPGQAEAPEKSKTSGSEAEDPEKTSSSGPTVEHNSTEGGSEKPQTGSPKNL